MIIHLSDGAIDDTISSVLISKFVNMPENFQAIVVTDADCIGKYACLNLLKIKKLLDINVSVGLSKSRVKNSFPWEWRNESVEIGKLKSLANIPANTSDILDGDQLLQDLLTGAENNSVVILATGPLTTLSDCLKNYPELSIKIKDIHWMGGAIDVPGNLDNSNIATEIKNKYAEWNAFSDVDAVSDIFQNSHAPNTNIYLYPLDLTNKSQVTLSLLMKLKIKSKNPTAKLFYEMYTLQLKNHYNNIWDVVATVGMLQHMGYIDENSKILNDYQELTLNIDTIGFNQGRIVKDINGRNVFVCKTFAENGVHNLHKLLVK